MNHLPSDSSRSNETRLSALFNWAIEFNEDPAMAVADWLARDLRPGCQSAVSLLTSPLTDLATLERAKAVYKTLRIVGETAADRRLGGRMYAASIAAALVLHGAKVSRQSDAALQRSFAELAQEPAVPEAIRDLAARAAGLLNSSAATTQTTGGTSAFLDDDDDENAPLPM